MMMRWQWQRQRRFTKHKVLLLILMVYCEGLSGITTSNIAGTRPLVVNIGALLDFDSTIGKVAKVAIQAAVEDVNNHQTVLQDATLHLSMQDTNYSGFLGLVEALSLMETEIVTIIGPQYSVNAHGVSYVANELQVPLLSFAATDPTLSSLQYPFFVRATHSDLFQMAAIAELVDYFGWKEVTAIYVDDDYGRDGIAALGDKLAERRCKILYKAGMSPQVSRDTITDVLVKVALMESRVLVLLAYPGWGLEVLNVAQYLGMMGSGYVWIATDWLTTVLDTDGPLTSGALEDVQGVLTLRMYTQDLQQKREFVSRWSELTEKKKVLGNIGLNTYGLYAYDAVWILAYAIDTFLNQGGNISFSQDARLSETDKGIMHAGTMSIFNEGKSLLQNILQFNKTGLTGPIKFTSDRNLANPAYEIINVIGNGVRKIGYWSNQSGLSIVPPGSLYTMPLNHSTQQLHSVIWPGQTTMKPRGWVFPNNGMHLRIGVPIRVSYREFVSVEGSDLFSGYCVDVFTAALNLLPYAVPYKFYAFGDGQINPKTDELLELMTAGMYDAAVGDIAITTDRLRIVDFTQPYVESGLVVVAPIRKSNSNALAFLSPFTPMMWCVTAIFFLIVGVVVWILEHRINDDFRGPPKRQLVTILWFSFSTLFFAHKENTMSTLGRFVLIIWLFVVLILNSSYIASLTSNLTVEQLSSPIKGIKSLVSSKDPIGYQRGSFTENYLTLEYNIDKSRLVPLDSAEEYVKALKDGPAKGGVAAVVDERAYMELFLSSRCEYSIVGRDFNKIGWGFAFPRDSPLAVDMSTAILKLSENGELQRIHDKWLLRSACRLEGAKEEAARLPLKSFWGLFVICGISALLAFLLYLFQMVHQFSKRYSEDLESLGRSQPPSRIQSFLSFVGEKKETKSRSKRRRMERATTRSTDGDESTNGSFKSNYSEV